MSFDRPEGGTILLSERALATIERMRQRDANSTEAGGVLIGRIISETKEVLVDVVTTPSTSDRRSRVTFFRAKRPTQAVINAAWTESGGEQNYLGEWHTHPEDHPTPSPVDRRNWHRLIREAEFEQESLFFVIAGRISIRIWEMRRTDAIAVRLVQTAVAADDWPGPGGV